MSSMPIQFRFDMLSMRGFRGIHYVFFLRLRFLPDLL